MPCSRIAISFSGFKKPALEMSTEERRIEIGSASTTLSAVTVFVAVCWAKVSVNVPEEFRRTATSSDPVVIWPARAAASRSDIWSLPPATWYFSFEAPKRRRLPGPR